MGLRWKLAREKAGFSQQRAAKGIGVSRSAISGLERGKYCPLLETAIELAILYQVSLDDMAMGDGKPDAVGAALKEAFRDTVGGPD